MTIKYNRVWTLILQAVAITACVVACTPAQQRNQEPSGVLSQAAVVTFASPRFNVAPASVIAWHSNIGIFGNTDAALDNATVDNLRRQIEAQLVARGFRISRDTGQGDYLLSGAIVLGDAMSERELAAAFNLQPSLLTNQAYETGTLVLRLLKPGSLSTQWQGTVEIYRDPGQSPRVRQERATMAVRRLVNQIPR